MAKNTEQPAADQSPADLLLTFRDKVYTSRTLIIPGSARTLLVAKGCVEVSVSDEQAIAYLKAHPEIEPPKE
ncbi:MULTISPECIES: hypothetical protein [Gammaproteobacteria]|uniref:hypothetical protein n=1 Tax=Gammaproteobacteria TaxID=1236 RepID=UPI0019146001|nr:MULTISPECIES: hypothetical protein [Gammaproteobacteria]MBK5299733.1 hypothetical protein [Bacillus sp. TH86]MBK5319502.1 hypothetical protein [Bacillus sp. TH59]MBK5334452.1 hypothetical protein [Bacillus sp. TH57]MBK5308541.1 hypothetical protein [Pseudomonas sp. TH71]MBK5314001.1 hypothetical protein [Erwinia sp. TH79]